MSEAINEMRQAGRAFATMLRVAARNPLWAFLGVITAPFRIWRPLGILLSVLLVSAFAIEALGGSFCRTPIMVQARSPISRSTPSRCWFSYGLSSALSRPR